MNAFWARFGANLVVAIVLGFTGVGMIVTCLLGLYIGWSWLRERNAYTAWREEVDQLLRNLGQDGRLLEGVPRTGTFAQFVQALVR